MPESSPVPSANTFVVRFWREWTAAGPRWRGQIEHIQSGESVSFLHLDAMLALIRRFGIMVDDEGQPLMKEE